MSASTDLGKAGITVNGAWSGSVAYEKNSIVNDGADSYISIQDVPIGTALSNTAYWTLLCNGFSSAEVVSAVNAWLVAHPEATTTVQDGAVTTAKLADGAVTDAKLAQSGGILDTVANLRNIYSQYPFVSKTYTVGDETRICPITDIYFEKYDKTKTYKLYQVFRNAAAGSNLVYVVTISDGTNNTHLLNALASSYSEKEYNEFNVDGLKGWFRIDWSLIENGTNKRFDNVFSPLCFRLTEIQNGTFTYPYTTITDCPIYDFRFTQYDPTKKYYIDGIGRAVNSTPVHYVRLRDSSNNTYLILNVLSSNYEEKAKNSFAPGYGNASLAGTYWIDWSKIPTGTQSAYAKPEISQLCMSLSDVYQTALNADIQMMLPDTIHAVVGHPFSIYYYNIFKMDSLDGYHVSIGGASSEVENMGDRVRFSCATAGTKSVTINLRKSGTQTIVSKTISVVIHAETIPSIKAIFIGDSFIDGGKIQAELKNMMGSNITFYGTRSFSTTDADGDTQTGNDEGRSSWSWANYLTLASKNGVTNAFWDGSKFDFSYYIAQNPTFADVTDVFLLSGPNDSAASVDTYITNYQAIVNSIKTYSDTIRIHCLMPLTVNCDGYAWGIRNYTGAQEYRYSMIEYGQGIIDTFTSDEQCFVIPTHVNFDRLYDFATTEVAANDRTPTLVKVFNDNVHPNEYGYFCMADMVLGDIVANCT